MSEAIAQQNFQRYHYAKRRGHSDYIREAHRLEGMYLGGGRQFTEEDRQYLLSQGRPAFEINLIKPKIEAAVGYQIANRMDISFRPKRGAASEDTAKTLSKLAMHIAGLNQYHWQETSVFSDGLIQQRGYFEVYLSYDDTLLGEVCIRSLDPLDVIPDPDAKSYDPDDWADVIITKWLTLNEIEVLYGKAARQKVEAEGSGAGYDDDSERMYKSRFGDGNTAYQDAQGDGIPRVLVIDRQSWEMAQCQCLISPTGDIRLAEDLPPERLEAMREAGYILQKRRTQRVRWQISTGRSVLYDKLSPFAHFTVVPFFPYFRRGQTRGMVDNAAGLQNIINKAYNQYLHAINSSTNGGWVSWEDTLANLREEDLEDVGAMTGLNVVLNKDTDPAKVPYKIQPNPVPPGISHILESAVGLIHQVTGINEALLGQSAGEHSGIAIQSRQHAAQQQLAVPLDNLARTRHLVAKRILNLVQTFYDDPRVERIDEEAANGARQTTDLQLNWPDEQQGVLNDVTLGEYDITITETPQQVTFENSQFMQMLELLEKGAPIPWKHVLRVSNLANKTEIVEDLEAAEQAQQPQDPLAEAKAAEILARTEKLKAETVYKHIESLYSALQGAGVIAQNPAVTPLADELAQSAGFEDKNAAPLIPQGQGGDGGLGELGEMGALQSPRLGRQAGIETPELGDGKV